LTPAVNENNKEETPALVSDVAALVSPSVVGITNFSSTGSIFDQRNVESTGSGVILDQEGYIVTNYHVVKGADRLIVTLADGNEEEAIIIGTDSRTDLALIKIKVDNKVTPVQFGDSDKLVVGERVIAIGNPLGLRFARSVTAGVVSGLNRLLTTEEGFPFRLIQTDAAINPGNSGGALVDLNGNLIGINTIKIAEQGFEGMGFSIPSNQVKEVISSIKKNGKVVRPIMGIKIIGEVSENQSNIYNLPSCCGVIIDPIRGGPAYQAGMGKYDIITAVNGKEVGTSLDLQEEIFNKKVGQTITVNIVRLINNDPIETEKKKIQVTLN